MNLIAENEFLKWIVGNDSERIGTPVLEWTNLPESWGVFVLLALVAGVVFSVFWLYRREMSTCPMSVRLIMAGLRLATMLFFIALFLRPSVFYQQVTEIKPFINLLRDESESFAHRDTYRNPVQAEKMAAVTQLEPTQIQAGNISREQLLNRALSDQRLLESLQEKGSVRVYDFSDGTRLRTTLYAGQDDATDTEDVESNPSGASPQSNPIPELKSEQPATNLWQALQEGLKDASQVSSIILVTDGQQNVSRKDPLEVARRAKSLGIPIHVVGVGDPNPPVNLKVDQPFVRGVAYPDEPFEIESSIQANLRDASQLKVGSIDVELVEHRIDENTNQMDTGKVVQTESVSIPGSGGRIDVDFSHQLSEPGSYRYTVRTAPLEDEVNVTDNQKTSAIIKVYDNQARVLLISGLPTFDFVHVYRLLERDQTINVSCWLQSQDKSKPQEGNVSISLLPRTPRELAKYNVILLMDPNPNEFDAQWIESLEWFVKKNAGGVMFMAGPQFTSEFVTLNRLAKIRELFPVELGDTESIDVNEALASAMEQRFGEMLTVKHNLDHPVMSFDRDPNKSQQLWDQMPGVYWSFPAIAPKPTARVLLENGDQVSAQGKQPLIVSGRAGSGTFLYLGFQGTWRWRPPGIQAQFFDRFWIQLTRFLIENRSLQARRGFIDTDKTEYQRNERITLIARVTDSELNPATDPKINVNIRNEDGQKQVVELLLRPEQPGNYEGSTIARFTGAYTAEIDLGEAETGGQQIQAKYQVSPSDVENGVKWLNERLLRDIAEQSGGEYFQLYELSELSKKIPDKTKRVVFKSPPKPLWDVTWLLRILFFLLPVILLTTEWGLRKWYKLL